MIAAFDLDGTLLRKNSSFAFCCFLCKKGLFSKKDLFFCTYAYVRHCYFGLSLWDLHNLVFSRLFLGRTLAQLTPYLDLFIKDQLNKLWYTPALLRLQQLQKRGVECLILSNSPSFLVLSIAEKIGVNKVFATEYRVNEKLELTGILSLMDGVEKGKVMSRFASKETLAFSDSQLDLPFLESAHTAIAVNPKSPLKKIAKERGWEIL